MNEPLDLAPELTHKERIEQLKEMRKRDGKQPFWKIARYEIKDVIIELNMRLTQYNSQSSYSTDFKILQTVQDFQYLIIPLQTFGKKQTISQRVSKAKIDTSKPVASLKDGKMIYFVTKTIPDPNDDKKEKTITISEFTMEKPKGV